MKESTNGNEVLKALYSSDPKVYYAWHFKWSVKNSSAWDLKSRSLNYAADLLAKDIQRKTDIGKRKKATPVQRWQGYEAVLRYPVYLMLKGFAFETMFKGFYFQGNGQWGKKVKTHDLVKLAGLFKLNLNETDKRYLKTLSAYIEWEGRYPTPSCPEKYLGITSSTHAFPHKWIENNNARYSAYVSAFYDRLVNAVIETLRKKIEYKPAEGTERPALKKLILKFADARKN